jgi:hypothetical protein
MFLSKAQRQLSTGYKQYESGFRKTPSSMREKNPDPPSAIFSKAEIGRGMTAPSSQTKKAKMSPRKLGKMGAAINTGMTAQRSKILAAIQRLPVSQQRKIYQALEGYAMD